MATDISLLNNVVQITVDGGQPTAYVGGAGGKYSFNAAGTIFNLKIGGANYSVALADLRIAGSGSAPADAAAAYTALSSVFTDAGGAAITTTLQQALDAGAVLDKDNTVLGADHSLAFDGFNRIYISADDAGDNGASVKCISDTGYKARIESYNATDDLVVEVTPTTATIKKNVGAAKNIAAIMIADDFADDAAAATGGIAVGSLYHNSGSVRVRLT